MGISPSDKPNKNLPPKSSVEKDKDSVCEPKASAKSLPTKSNTASFIDSSLSLAQNNNVHFEFKPFLNLLSFISDSENVCIAEHVQTHIHQDGQTEFSDFINTHELHSLLKISITQFLADPAIKIQTLKSQHLPAIFSTSKLCLLLSNEVALEQDLILAALVPDDFEWTHKHIAAAKDLFALFNGHLSKKSTDTAILKSEALFKEMANLSHDFLYVKDSQGSMVYANQAVLSLFHQDELNTPKSISDKVLNVFEHSASQAASSDVIKQVEADNGDQILLQSHHQSFCLPDNSEYTLMVSRDVTQREVIINDLRRSNKDLDYFAYIASHDLKAPLNVIKRLVSWVIEDCGAAMPQDCLENLELVMNRANRMEQLLQDLLSYSRIGRDYLEAKELNVKDKVIELLSLIDLPMGFSMKCDDAEALVPEVPFGVVLLNLIANAIKHHDSGNAKIQVKVRRTKKANVITVIDNGPGIAKENQERIFDLFETLKPRDEEEGSGMGLSVVKRLVEHYGGNIKVEENRPRGTKFVVHWPFENIARKVLTQIHQQ
jgi:signal transduction histidine kinase